MELMKKWASSGEAPVMDEEREYLTADEVAADLGMSKQFVYKIIKLGKLRAQHIGRFVRVYPDDLAAYKARSWGGGTAIDEIEGIEASTPQRIVQAATLSPIPIVGKVGTPLEDIPVALTAFNGVHEALIDWGDGASSNGWYLEGTIRGSHIYRYSSDFPVHISVRLGSVRASVEGRAYIAEPT